MSSLRIAMRDGLILLLLALLAVRTGQAQAPEPDHVPGRYIVLLAEGIPASPEVIGDIARAHQATIHHHYGIIRGFAASVPLAALGRLMGDRRIRLVELDGVAWALGKGGGGGGGGGKPPAGSVQPPQEVPSGVARIGADRNAAGRTGQGVRIAVVDTGIDLDHPDLAANLQGGATFVFRTKSPDDDNGHGTHVAGIVGALDNAIGVRGVAPQSSLYAVKVLDRRGSGTYSAIIAGVDWAVANGMHVMNMSLGGSLSSEALHEALLNAKAAGITTVVAAGNSGQDASLSYPAAYDDAVLTISALDDATDVFPGWSNHGVPPVDLGAPGASIRSTYKDSGYAALSGTSMASPHVAGSAALWIQSRLDQALPWTPDELRQALMGVSIPVAGNDAKHPEPLVQAGEL